MARTSSTRRSRCAGDHLSVYQLTIEPGTAFHDGARARRLRAAGRRARGRALRGDARAARRAPACRPTRFPTTRGRAGMPAQSRLLALWRLCRRRPRRAWPPPLGGEKFAMRQHRAPETWLAAVEAKGKAPRRACPCVARETARGIADDGPSPRRGFARAFRTETGVEIDALGAPARSVDRRRFPGARRAPPRATAAGRQRLNAVLARLLAQMT